MKFNFEHNQKKFRCLIKFVWNCSDYYIQEQYSILGLKFYRKIYKFSTHNLPGPVFMNYEKYYLELSEEQRQRIFKKMIETFKRNKEI